jgi:hypothetical protein
MSAWVVGIDDSDFHLTHNVVTDDADARRVVSRHGSRHASNLELLAFDAYPVRHGDLDLAAHRNHLDLGCARQESGVPEIESNATEEHVHPEMSGEFPVSLPLSRRYDRDDCPWLYFQRLDAIMGESCRTKIISYARKPLSVMTVRL